jgi:hypothetical protein
MLVLDAHHLCGEVALRPVPGRVDAQRLDVDPLLVHRLEALSADFVDAASEPGFARGNAEQRLGLRNDAMGVRRLLLRALLVVVPAMALWALLPLVAAERLGLAADGYGALFGALGVGAIVGALILGWVQAGYLRTGRWPRARSCMPLRWPRWSSSRASSRR